MALKVNEIVKVEVEASDGQILRDGDAIMLRVSRRTPEDVVCRFAGLSNGYFVTTTLDGQYENKYRQSSIETCYRINPVERVPLINAVEDVEENKNDDNPVWASFTE